MHLGTILVFGASILVIGRRKSDIARREPNLSRWDIDIKVLTTIPLAFWFIGPPGAVLLPATALQFVSPVEGYVEHKDGTFVLANHGRTIREITEEEFHHANTQVARGFCAIWLAFTWLATAFFWIGMQGPASTNEL
ncbi:hypothetical protein PX52LOC_03161 [Limnoglobus roseus]|uniref:Uncharacterized protein n=1 Tax=Limnoglobus roseus TaxID=2598579 RepID=A0A5C1AAI0_9BACT|nr:hypothetical protein PX52LOC_03161 [Limnoglobus roseus]